MDDPRVAEYARVGDARWLREHGLFVAEGRLVVRRLLTDSRFRACSILVTPTALPVVADLLDRAPCPVYISEQALMNAVAGFNFHRGCLAIGDRSGADVALDDLAASRLLLALEGVGNPDNVGGIFRLAAAFEAGGVLLGPASADPLYRKAIRTSMGAALRVPFAVVEAWPAGLERLRTRGFTLAALTPAATGIPIAQFAASLPPTARVVLMLGSEGDGLPASSIARADVSVRIPIAHGVDSLNVVTAAAIALSAVGCQRLGIRD